MCYLYQLTRPLHKHNPNLPEPQCVLFDLDSICPVSIGCSQLGHKISHLAENTKGLSLCVPLNDNKINDKCLVFWIGIDYPDIRLCIMSKYTIHTDILINQAANKAYRTSGVPPLGLASMHRMGGYGTGGACFCYARVPAIVLLMHYRFFILNIGLLQIPDFTCTSFLPTVCYITMDTVHLCQLAS